MSKRLLFAAVVALSLCQYGTAPLFGDADQDFRVSPLAISVASAA